MIWMALMGASFGLRCAVGRGGVPSRRSHGLGGAEPTNGTRRCKGRGELGRKTVTDDGRRGAGRMHRRTVGRCRCLRRWVRGVSCLMRGRTIWRSGGMLTRLIKRPGGRSKRQSVLVLNNCICESSIRRGIWLHQPR
jgi:hypothetical protein